MNKKNQNNLVTSRVLKSKYHEREKQKTIPLRKKTLNNLKITDLCPEEKIKIGELIRILQLRRIQNLQLQNDNQRLKEHIYHCEIKLDQMKNDCLETQSQIADLKDKITSLKAMINLYEQKLTKMSENVKVSSSRNTMYTKGFQTQQITTRMESCQTLLIDHKQIGSQTDTQRDENFLFYRANSKSFEKIMKGVLQKNLQKKVLSDKDQSAEKSSSVIRSKFDNYHISSKNNFSDSSCESLGQIEQKWNLLKIKNQAELAISKQLNSINEFECSSPSKNDSSHASQNPIKIDAITLNRMIKKKDFSVTTLMKTEKMKQIKRDSHQVSYLKSPYFNRPQVDHSLLKPLTNQSYNDSRSKPSFRLNFYESGLSDMGSSLR